MKYAWSIFILFWVIFNTPEIFAFFPQDNYLWIEFTKVVKEKDGSVVLPLKINYGRFPREKKGIEGLDSLKAVYSLVKEDSGIKSDFYQAEIEKESGEYVVKIKSFQEGCFIVFAEAEKTYGKITYRYLAKAAFTLFGHSSLHSEKTDYAAASRTAPELEISISPQFHYWPQIEEPVKVSVLFEKNYLPGEKIYFFDENLPYLEAISNQAGNFIYTPPDDKKLNAQSEIAFKQTVVVAEEEKDGFRYISSYTLLLHRNRLKHYRLFLGAVIFLGSVFVIFSLVVMKRKRFGFEII